MKRINKQAVKVFMKLVAGLEGPGDARKVDNASGSFMAVSIDLLRVVPADPERNRVERRIYSVAHNHIVNGDVCADPDVEFYVACHPSGWLVFPTAFEQGGMLYDRCIEFADDGITPSACYTRRQADLAGFCNTWMNNIKHQQEL